MSSLLQSLGGCALTTVVGLVLNKVMAILIPSKEMSGGFYRWRWVLSALVQTVIFPALIGSAYVRRISQMPLSEFLNAPATDDAVLERWYVYALFATQSRDMIPRMPAAASTTMIVHHWVVVIACLMALHTPQGFGYYVLGTFALECGSLTYNLRTLYPKSKLLVVVYQTIMALSNIVAVLIGVAMVWTCELPMAIKALFLVADVGVCIGREHHALKDLGVLGSAHKRDANSAETNGKTNGASDVASADDKAPRLRTSRPETGGS
eukprot:TRINITY_DN76959_c0_g1_i1.p1 TRINITY_DN76959_c0_g1~~TRINITY_DN76959_c0_g1_i1.p1  ORF type:complete len:265 (-),score=53.17 TRINITY_DN76959_c0_g1_i1:157-951(-)